MIGLMKRKKHILVAVLKEEYAERGEDGKDLMGKKVYASTEGGGLQEEMLLWQSL